MIRVTRHNDLPTELTAELVRFIDSLPESVAFVNIDGTVLLRGDGLRAGSPYDNEPVPGCNSRVPVVNGMGERHAGRKR